MGYGSDCWLTKKFMDWLFEVPWPIINTFFVCFYLFLNDSSGRWGVLVNVMNYDIGVSDLKLHSRYYVHFWTNAFKKGMNSLIPPAIS